MSETSDDMAALAQELEESMYDEPEMDEVTVLKMERETEKAWLLQLDLGYSWWLPKSQCTFDERRMTVEIPSWLVQRKTDEEEEAARNRRELENEARKIAEDEMDERYKL